MNIRNVLVAASAGAMLLGTSVLAAPAPSKTAAPATAAAKSAPPAPPSLPTGDYTAEERKEIQELVKEAGLFSTAAKQYRTTVNGIVKREYTKRRKSMMTRYEKQIREEEAEERVQRIAAITLFEDFLRRYPNDKRWTPDVIFRLAELYFEKAHDEYLQAEERYQKNLMIYEEAMDEFKKGALASEPQIPAPPKQNYGQTIMLHRKLIREFPRYRLIDGAYYLLGFCLGEMAKETQGNQAYLSLVCSNRYRPPLSDEEPETDAAAEGGAAASTARPALPGAEPGSLMRPSLNLSVYKDCVPLVPKSRFIPESWIRIGEFHFDENQFGEAIAAYERVLSLGTKKNPYYDEALYKLAWTYYRADRFTEAIKHFDQLVVYADKEYKRTGKYGSEMRPESIQYLGISFAEEDWDGDTLPDAETGMQRIEQAYAARSKEKHVYEIYKRLGDIYFDTNKYDDAVKVYKLMMDRWPYRSDNPDVQDKVILALERQRKFDDAMTEREEFTRRFGKGTEWEKRNQNNTKALKKAQEYDEQALIQAAVFHHKKGQEAKKRGVAMNDGTLLQQAAQEYSLAAKAYAKYIERFPNTKNSYEIKYSYASCLYYSQRFLLAGKAFETVRDSNLDNRYLEEAAFSAIKAYEEYINLKVQSGELPNPPLPKADKPPASLTPMPLPEIYGKWQKAMDTYTKVLPKSAKTPRLTYKSAEVSYRFINFDDARKRMAIIYDKHCGDPMALNAGQAVLVTYKLEKNMDKMEEWALKLKDAKCTGGKTGVAVDAKTAAGMQKLIIGIRFKRAQTLMKNKKWDEAAKAFIAIVDANPKDADSDKALNNAAVCYESSKRFDSAVRIYERIWQQYPNSQFADEALWRTAINYQRGFEFSKAVNNFLILADSPKFASSKHRTDSIYNAAVILENDQAYTRSARLFIRYASAKGTTKEGADSYFRAGEIYEKMGDYGAMVRIFRDFPTRFGSVPNQAARIVEGLYKIGKGAHKRNDWRTTRKYYRMTISEFTMRGLPAASDAAEYAANAAFELIEPDMKAFLAKSIKGAINTIPRQETKMAIEAKKLYDRYKDLWKYKRARWTLASMYRHGQIYEHFGRIMDDAYRNAPIPRKLKKLGDEAVDMYRTQVDELMVQRVDPIVTRAKELYKACVDRAKQMGASNKYTEGAHRKLAAFDPINYPLLKRAKVEYSIE